jgi:hypothetical protein
MSFNQRFALTAALAFAFVPPSHADTPPPPLDPIFAAIHDGDAAQVEDILAAAAALDGDARFLNERALYSVFGVADPRIFDFVEEWLKEKPEMAAPHIAAAKMFQSMAYRARGTDIARFTYPEASRLFSGFMAQSAEEVWRAYEIAPENVVTGDMIMELRDRTDGKPDRMTVLAGIMETSPNWMSVVNAAGSFAPQWGGSLEEMAQVCDGYAAASRADPPIDAAFCIVYSAYDANLPRNFLDQVDPLLKASDDPRLDFARRARATRTMDLSEADVGLLQSYLSDPATTDLKTARYYDAYARMHGLPVFEVEVINRAMADARDKIANQPYSSSLLKLLATQQTRRVPLTQPGTAEEATALFRKRLVYAPYNSEYWQDYAFSLFGEAMGQTEASNAAYRNAIVYSNYRPERIAAYMELKGGLLTEFLFLRSQGRFSDRFPEGYATISRDVTCPLVALMRMYDEVCGATGNERYCRADADTVNEWRLSVDIPLAEGACALERGATLAELAFEPTPLASD